MQNQSISVVIPSLDEDQKKLSKVIDHLKSNPMVNEVIVVDDCSSVPLRLQNAKVIRNAERLGSAKSRAIGISQASGNIIVTTDAHIRFLTNDWGEKISRIILKDEKTIVCPICIPTGECSFKGRMYGGSLECLSVRPGVGVVLESRWNTSPKQGDAVECVMGGAYAFDAGWHRKTGGYGGIKGCCQTELVSISLRTRLAGGRCVVADVEMEHEFRSSPQFRVTPSQSAYNKIRLASVVFPPEVFAAVPALLRGSVGLEEGLKSFIEDFKASVDDRDSFWHLCGGDPWESAKRAGIAFGIDFKARKTVG